MQLALPNFRVVNFALWAVSAINRAQTWAADFIGLTQSSTEVSQNPAAKIERPAGLQIRRASILDTGIVLLGLASIILTGLMVGRTPGTLSVDSIWQVIFGLCAAAMVYCGVRIFRLARP